jgi:serine/threonine protein kinase
VIVQQIGRYQIVEELGRGAMGVVYRALDPRIGRTIAIKSIRLSEISDASELQRLRDRLEREARSAGALSHRNIVTIYDLLEQDGLVHLFMEYVNGPSLQKMLNDSSLPEKLALLDFLRQVAAGLDYAHKKGIVHRDVKPSNLMSHVDSASEERIAKITDFGVAKFASQQMTRAGTMMGTPNYMAPEQIEGKPVSGQTDQFALAVVAYELLVGEKPFVADYLPTLFLRIVREDPIPAHRVNTTLTGYIDAVLQRALSKDPVARYESCTGFISALCDACAASAEWTLPRRASVRSRMQSKSAVAVETVEIVRPTIPEPPAPAPFYPPDISEPPFEPRSQNAAYDFPPSRRRPFLDSDDEELPTDLSPWRKLAIALLILAMGAIAYGVYQNYTRTGVIGFPGVTHPETAGTSESDNNGTPEGPETSQTPPAKSTQSEAAPPPVLPPVEQPRDQREPGNEQAASHLPSNISPGQSEASQTRVPVQPQRAASSGGGLTEVRFVTIPEKAKVVIDGRESLYCVTPCSLNLTTGRHTLILNAPGAAVAQRIIQVPDERNVYVALQQSIGTVQVDSVPTGSAIYIDGHLQGQTPASLKLSPGPHRIKLVNGLRTHDATIDVTADNVQTFTFRFKAEASRSERPQEPQ